MHEADVEALLGLMALVVLAAVLLSAATLLARLPPAQRWPSLTGNRMPVRVPPSERRLFLRTAMEAIVMARKGEVDEGYEHLLAGRRQLLARVHGNEPWFEEVFSWYQRALDRYVSRHGSGS